MMRILQRFRPDWASSDWSMPLLFACIKARFSQDVDHTDLILFVLMLYIQVKNFSVMLERFPVFLGWTSKKQLKKYLAQGHDTVTPVRVKLATLLLYQLSHCALLAYGARSLVFSKIIYIFQCYVYGNSQGSLKTAGYQARKLKCIILATTQENLFIRYLYLIRL